jgi:hypothetical protein
MNDIPFYYFAYGSNLPLQRMLARTSPDLRLRGTYEWREHRLSFDKRSEDGSGKCTAVPSTPEQVVWGTIYQVTHADKLKLAKCEVGYHEVPLRLLVDGEPKLGFTFVANPDQIDTYLYPYTWYKRYVVAGAREHKFPSAYISEIEAVRARPDPKPERSAGHEPLLLRLESALKVRDAPP